MVSPGLAIAFCSTPWDLDSCPSCVRMGDGEAIHPAVSPLTSSPQKRGVQVGRQPLVGESWTRPHSLPWKKSFLLKLNLTDIRSSNSER